MFELELGCDPKTDHLSAKNVFPLFRQRFRELETQVTGEIRAFTTEQQQRVEANASKILQQLFDDMQYVLQHLQQQEAFAQTLQNIQRDLNQRALDQLMQLKSLVRNAKTQNEEQQKTELYEPDRAEFQEIKIIELRDLKLFRFDERAQQLKKDYDQILNVVKELQTDLNQAKLKLFAIKHKEIAEKSQLTDQKTFDEAQNQTDPIPDPEPVIKIQIVEKEAQIIEKITYVPIEVEKFIIQEKIVDKIVEVEKIVVKEVIVEKIIKQVVNRQKTPQQQTQQDNTRVDKQLEVQLKNATSMIDYQNQQIQDLEAKIAELTAQLEAKVTMTPSVPASPAIVEIPQKKVETTTKMVQTVPVQFEDSESESSSTPLPVKKVFKPRINLKVRKQRPLMCDESVQTKEPQEKPLAIPKTKSYVKPMPREALERIRQSRIRCPMRFTTKSVDEPPPIAKLPEYKADVKSRLFDYVQSQPKPKRPAEAARSQPLVVQQLSNAELKMVGQRTDLDDLRNVLDQEFEIYQMDGEVVVKQGDNALRLQGAELDEDGQPVVFGARVDCLWALKVEGQAAWLEDVFGNRIQDGAIVDRQNNPIGDYETAANSQFQAVAAQKQTFHRQDFMRGLSQARFVSQLKARADASREVKRQILRVQSRSTAALQKIKPDFDDFVVKSLTAVEPEIDLALSVQRAQLRVGRIEAREPRAEAQVLMNVMGTVDGGEDDEL